MPLTNHHPRCEYVGETLIDVWKVSIAGTGYYIDQEPNPDEIGENETITKERMHREIFVNLPEFAGF